MRVVVDGPQGFSNSVTPIWETTQPSLAVLRLSGRNAASRNVRGAVASSSRFDFAYREDELRELGPRIESLRERVDRLLVVFNTNEVQGQRNGRALMALLSLNAPGCYRIIMPDLRIVSGMVRTAHHSVGGT